MNFKKIINSEKRRSYVKPYINYSNPGNYWDQYWQQCKSRPDKSC